MGGLVVKVSILLALTLCSSCNGVRIIPHAAAKVSAPAPGDKVVNVNNYGTKGDGSDATQAFLSAWKDACSSSVAVTFLVPASSTYLLKPIPFTSPCKSDVTMTIQGTIVASSKVSDWDGKNRRRWIEFDKVNNLHVQGGGTIDGSGAVWWKISCKVDTSQPCLGAPTAMTFDACNNLKVENLLIRNSQQMHITFDGCKDVKVSSLTIRAPETSPNTDGIHVTGTTNIQISDCNIRTGNIGSLGGGGALAQVSSVLVDKATLTGTTNGVRIKTYQGGRGYAKNITFQNVEMHNVKNPIIINQSYCDPDHGSCKQQQSSSAVEVSNVLYKNIKGTSSTKVAITFDCNKSTQCRGIVLQDVNLVATGGGATSGVCNNVQLTQKGTVVPSTCAKTLLETLKDDLLSTY